MSEQEIWWEGKAFTAGGQAEGEIVKAFRGPSALAEAKAWFEHVSHDVAFDAGYVYEHQGDQSHILYSWSDTYGMDYGDSGEDDDGDDDDEFGDDPADWAEPELPKDKPLVVPDDILPGHVGQTEVANLIATLEEVIEDDPVLRDALNACNLEPTTRSAWLAASAAVHVLLAHEIGQEVADQDEEDARAAAAAKPDGE